MSNPFGNAICVRTSDNYSFLMQRNVKTPNVPGVLAFPGGLCEPKVAGIDFNNLKVDHQKMEDQVKREFRSMRELNEEIGIDSEEDIEEVLCLGLAERNDLFALWYFLVKLKKPRSVIEERYATNTHQDKEESVRLLWGKLFPDEKQS